MGKQRKVLLGVYCILLFQAALLLFFFYSPNGNGGNTFRESTNEKTNLDPIASLDKDNEENQDRIAPAREYVVQEPVKSQHIQVPALVEEAETHSLPADDFRLPELRNKDAASTITTATEPPLKQKKDGYEYKMPKHGELPKWCQSRQSFVNALNFDPFDRYVPAELETPSPFQRCDSGLDFGKIYIPARSYSTLLKTWKYGGLTADMGWILLVARAAVYDNVAVEFPPYWGHGCYDAGQKNPSWTCLFQPIVNSSCSKALGPNHSAKRNLVQEKARDRHHAKLYHVYKDPTLTLERNMPVAKLVQDWFSIGGENDIQAMRQIFNWVFHLRPELRVKVDEIKASLKSDLKISGSYIGIHIRGGDKVGHNAGGPLEAYEVPSEVYAQLIKCFFLYDYPSKYPAGSEEKPTVFIASDEYLLVEQLMLLLGDRFRVVTSSTKAQVGFNVNDYRGETSKSDLEQARKKVAVEKSKLEQAIHLWADMEILAEAHVFVTSLQSNVARMIHLMRLGKPVNSTLSIPLHNRKISTCCLRNTVEALLANCFWFCT